MNGRRSRWSQIVILLQRCLRSSSLRLSIMVRLALGFLLAALLAATATGIIGFQRISLLHAQSTFYQALLQTTINLTTGSDFLKSIELQTTMLLTDLSSGVDQETLASDEQEIQTLLQQYNTIVNTYINQDLLALHPDQVTVLNNTKAQLLVVQQRAYAAGALRAWYLYKDTTRHVLQDVDLKHINDGQTLARLQGEPEFGDALSSLRSLIQFNEQLAGSVDGATSSPNLQSLIALLGTFLVFMGVVLIGFFISRPLIVRLRSLHRVTQAVRQGHMSDRVNIKGHDEITDVSRSVNTMLDALEVALQQATTAREQTNLAYIRQRQLNEMKDQFISHVSHELRTPLTEVYGFLQLLQDHQDELDPVQRHLFVAQATKGCEELITMCTSILDASDQTVTMQPSQRVPIILTELVEELLAQRLPQEKAEHPVYLNIPLTLVAQADPQYVRQIFRNLLSNAFKYTPINQAIFIEAFASKPASDVEQSESQIGIRVRDTGPGVPPEEQDLLFQPFVRLRRDLTGNIRGTGLGLFLCRQFVEAMGGRIWVESTGIPGEGSSFCFTLPTASPETDVFQSSSEFLPILF